MPAPAQPHSRTTDSSQGFRATRWAIAILVVATCCRLVVAAILPLGVDEAYAIGVARQYSLSYFDHPPLHFWLVGAWAKLWGSEAPFLLRLPFVGLAAVSSWLMFRLSERLFGNNSGVWAIGLFSVAPVFGLVHGTLILPDGPLICAGLGLVVVFERLMFETAQHESRKLVTWAGAGFLAGLAMLSKYHGLLLVAGLALFLLTSRHWRWLLRPGPWLAATIAAIMFLPVVVWNVQNNWVSLAFQAGRGNWDGSPELLGALTSLVAQAAYLVPWLAVPLAFVLLRAVLGGPKNDRRWLLACAAVPPILLFTVAASLGRGLPHWQMPGWLFALPLLAEYLAGLPAFYRRAAAALGVVTAVALAVLISGATAQARWGTFDSFVREHIGSDPTDMLQPWDGIPAALAAHGLPRNDRTFVAAFSWIRAGELNAVVGKSIPVLCICRDARHFAYLNPLAAFADWDAILIDAPSRIADDRFLGPMFTDLGSIEDISLTKAGRVAVPLSLRTASQFQPSAIP